MKRRRLAFALTGALLLIMAMPVALFASDITNARYFGNILITNTSTAATNVATTATISTPDLIAGGFSNATASDIVIRNSAGADAIFMPGFGDSDPWSIWVPSIGENAIQTYIFYSTISTGGAISYFPADGGMAVADHASLELGNNFIVSLQGYFDLTGVGDNITTKAAAFRTYISASGEITSLIDSLAGSIQNDGVALDYTRGNSDFTTIPDAADLSFTNGAGADRPCSIIAWVYIEDATNSTFISKNKAAATEWYLKTSTELLTFIINKADGSAWRSRTGSALNAFEGQWIHIAATYDASETSAGINLYLNGVDDDDATDEGGAYTGMSDGGAIVAFGGLTEGASQFLDGSIERIKIYDVELSAPQVLADFNGTHKATDLVAFWEIDEGTGNPADSSGNGHNATANLADWIASANVTAQGVSNGDMVVATTDNTTHLWIDIDGVTANTTATIATVTNNANAWEFAGDGSMLYMTTANVTVSGTLAGSWEWEYAATFTDDSVNSNTATPTFRAASSNANVTGNLTSFRPVAEAQAPAYSLGTAPDFIDSDALTGNVTGTFGTTPSAGAFPLANVITSIANATSTPAQLPLMIIAAFIILAASLSISALMRRHGSGTLLIKIGVIVTFLGIFIALANFGIDFWMLVLFLIIAIGLTFASRQLGFT